MAHRVSKYIIDEIADELTSGEMRKLIARLRSHGDYRLRVAKRRVKGQLGDDGYPKNVPFQEPADLIYGKAIRDRLEVEEAIARLRERAIKTVEPAHRLLSALAGQQQSTVTVEFTQESDDDKPDE